LADNIGERIFYLNIGIGFKKSDIGRPLQTYLSQEKRWRSYLKPSKRVCWIAKSVKQRTLINLNCTFYYMWLNY